MHRVLVVGAGFAGAVYARQLADAGWLVDVIDQRPHVGGNCHDAEDANGLRVHTYGPHLFHTNNERVARWIERFGAWIAYEHRVKALLPDGREVPLPVNRNTINAIHGTSLTSDAEVRAFLESIALSAEAPANAAGYLYGAIGRTLTDLLFRPYTQKMWRLALEEMECDVVRRIPIRYDEEDRYFPNDTFQLLPRDGYTAVFHAILDHARIRVRLETAYEHGMERDYLHVFNSMPIDVYFGADIGELPYRSIRFHHRTSAVARTGNAPVLNFTDDGPYTRETSWHLLPGHRLTDTGRSTVTREEPCDYRDNGNERYYPVRTADDRYGKLYERYAARAAALSNMTFIGRCGTYRYLDMHQVINQSLEGAAKWLRAQGTPSPARWQRGPDPLRATSAGATGTP